MNAKVRHRGLLFIGLLLALGCSLLTARGQTPAADPDETIRIESDLVDLKVGVWTRGAARPQASLGQKDFVVFENGAVQEITFFASPETPFDLVLLLDLSGSTAGKLDLIKKSAQRFVEAVPARDRIGIVTFTKETRVEVPLTLDREVVRQAIEQIKKPNGGTNFWDALSFVLESVLPPNLPRSQRRAAVVAMTDGVDNALPDVIGEGSQTTFGQLIQALRGSEAIVLPIYLDTEEQEVKRKRIPASAYGLAREQLATLAEESGNVVYQARELKDLEKVYQRAILDLRTVYSIGYRPTNPARDGSWRAIRVQVPGRPELIVRTKPGYFAR